MNVLLNTLVPEESYENYRDDEYSDAIYAEMSRATEELNFMDSFLKVSEINATNKLKMVKKLKKVYGNSIFIDTENVKSSETVWGVPLYSTEGVIGAVFNLIGALIRLVGTIIKFVVTQIIKIFIKNPIRNIDKERVYRMYKWKKKHGKRGKESLDQSVEEKGATVNDQVLDWDNLSDDDIANIHKQICAEIRKATDTFANDRQDDVKQMFLSMFFNPKIQYETMAKFGEIVVKRSEEIQITTSKMCKNVAENDSSLEKLFNLFNNNNKEYGDVVKKILYNGGEKKFPDNIDGAIDQIATQFYNYDVCVKCVQFLNASKETAESCKKGLSQANDNLKNLQGIIKEKRGELNEFHKKIIHVVGKGITYFQHISINYFKICVLCRTIAEKFDPKKKYVSEKGMANKNNNDNKK